MITRHDGKYLCGHGMCDELATHYYRLTEKFEMMYVVGRCNGHADKHMVTRPSWGVHSSKWVEIYPDDLVVMEVHEM
jgi:hypothetical protein